MSYQKPPISKEAGADFSAETSRYLGVTLNSDEEAVLPSAGGAILGVLSNTPEEGETARIETPGGGEVPLRLGGTITAGMKLKVANTGKFVEASAGDIAAGSAVAFCTKGGADGEVGAGVLFGGAGTRAATTGSESPSGVAGNYDLTETTDQSLLTLGTANRTGALPDGLWVGQRKRIRVIAASGGFTYALTPTTMQAGQPTSFTFTALGQYIELTWSATGWVVTDVKTAGAGTTADAGTINLLIARQGLAIAGTEDRILPNGWVPGHTIKIAVDTDTSGSTTISGLFYDEDGSADGVDVTYNDALDEAMYTWDGARWMLHSIISVAVT